MSKSSRKNSQLRLRVFAGPNGSGKSTVIAQVRNHRVKGKLIDFGYYINADDIAVALADNTFSFGPYRLSIQKKDVVGFAERSGLLSDRFNSQQFSHSFRMYKRRVNMLDTAHRERVAQIFARFLRQALLNARKRFSFETVFSHPSNLDVMNEARNLGYKVYLYFVSTASPQINKFRVEYRVSQGGHDVPAEKIESRYYRSLKLMRDAAGHAYQAFFFDNSDTLKLIAHFKLQGENKKWDRIPARDVPEWFKKYYGKKD